MPQEAKGNSDTSDNETHYYLADLMGNHVATVRDASESAGSAPSWQAFDAFGSALGKSGGVAGSLGWRGGEGSVSDRETGLVYMQSRHYDPSLGRFLQADALPLASLTTQGANRYIYCENDPVNRSDPTGNHPLILAIAGIVWAASWYMLRALARSHLLHPILVSIKNKAMRCFLEELLGFLTGVGPLGWLGLGLIFGGWAFTHMTAGLGFPIGGTVSLIGWLLYGIDRLINTATDWAVDSVLDWLFTMQHWRDCKAKEYQRRWTVGFGSGFA